MAIIKSPNPKYSGVSAGVPFVNGKGETDNPLALAYFKRHGYEIVEPPKPAKKPKEKDGE